MPKISILIFLLELYTGFRSLDLIINLISTVPEAENTLNISSIIKNLLLISSLLSLLIGSIVGLAQIKIKRLLAWG